jgi:hypothetical protein
MIIINIYIKFMIYAVIIDVNFALQVARAKITKIKIESW